VMSLKGADNSWRPPARIELGLGVDQEPDTVARARTVRLP